MARNECDFSIQFSHLGAIFKSNAVLNQNVRRRLALVLVAIMCLSSTAAFFDSIEVNEQLDDKIESSYKVTIKNENIDLDLWNNLLEKDLFVLRSSAENEIIVWSSANNLIIALNDLNLDYSILPTQTDLRSPNGYSINDFSRVKFILEPNLPSSSIEIISHEISYYGQFNEDQIIHDFPLAQGLEILLVEEISDGFSIPGVMWVEPVLETSSRNLVSSGLIQSGEGANRQLWDLGINGEGVIIGVADSGIDYDHSCFLNRPLDENSTLNTSEFGDSHSKIQLVNFTIDDGDYIGDSDYGHGTHISGTLACKDVNQNLTETPPSYTTTSPSYESKIIFQDIVNESGWSPPDIDELLSESAINGGYIHSNSWGDATTAYTERSAMIDAWSREFPWTLTFIAPGNNGGTLLEPANARNAIAVGASEKSSESSRWGASSHGPDDSGRNGIFILAPGVGVYSAKADGQHDSFNQDSKRMSGTSMATPMAASTTALISQMVQEGWLTGYNETREMFVLGDITPAWGDQREINVSLGEGFVPSAPLMKSLLAISADNIDFEPNNNETPNQVMPRNPYDGWGQPNLENLIQINQLTDNADPTKHLWIHDSYRLIDSEPKDLLAQRTVSGNISTDALASEAWDTEGMVGPFLKTGEVFSNRFMLQPNLDFEAFLSWPSRPEYIADDDLVIVATLQNGKKVISGDFNSTGYSDMFSPSIFDPENESQFPKDGENTHAIILSSESLQGNEWIELSVMARNVAVNGNESGLGLAGDQVGFGLAVSGIVKDPTNWKDSDNDGVFDEEDLCPDETPVNDQNLDGCIDDLDEDGVLDDYDLCIDNSENGINPDWGVDFYGCAIVNNPPLVEFVTGPYQNQLIIDDFLFSYRLSDIDGDNVVAQAKIITSGNLVVYSCQEETGANILHSCIVKPESFSPFFISENESLSIEIIAWDMNESYSRTSTITYRNQFTLEEKEEIVILEPSNQRNDNLNLGRLFLLGLLFLIAPTLLVGAMKKRQLNLTNTVGIPDPFTDDYGELQSHDEGE